MKRYGHAIAAVISLLYVIAGWLWIFISDRSSMLLFEQSPLEWLKFQTYKGFGFVLFSGLLFYILLRTYIVSYRRAEIYWGLVERSLQGFFIVQDGRIVLTNRAALEMIGYSADQIYALPIWHALKLVCPEDRRGLMQNIRALVEGKITSCTQEICFHSRDGRTLWLLILLESITYKGRNAIQFMYLDISDRKTGEQILQRKDRILEAVSFAAEQFLQAGTWTEAIQPVMERLGQAAEVSRVYIFSKHNSDQQKTLVSQVCEWIAPGITSQMDNSALQGLDVAKAGFQRWLDNFEKHLPVYGLVRDFPESERSFLFSQGIKSLLCVPIFVQNNLWGFIGFDDCLNERHWSKNEIEALEIAASIFESAIDRQRSEIATERQVRELIVLHKVSIAQAEANSIDELLKSVTYIIGEAFYSDNFGVLLLEEDGKTLHQHASYCGVSSTMAPERFPVTEGITGRVARTGKPLRIGDVRTCKDYIEITPEVRSELCVPIKIGERVLGVINAESRELNAFSEDDERLLATIADIAGSAIHRMNLYRNVESQVRRLTALRDVDIAIASSFDLRVTLTILIDNAISHLNVDAAAVLLYNPNSQMLSYAFGRGFRTSYITHSILRIGEGLPGRAALNRSLIAEPDLPNSQLFHRRELLAGEDFRCYYAVPLIAKGQVKGVLEIFHRSPLTPTPDWLEFLRTLAGQAAIAIDNTQMFDKLQRSNQELIMAYDTTLEGWSKALELRDRETEGHAQRVTELTLELARRMGVPPADLVHIRRGVLLHDIGKMGIPDQILRKTGPLTKEEWAIMRQHPKLAYDLLAPIAYLRPARDIPYCHHEMWNGKGYPRGLKGEEIPIAARIFSVVDVWDALAFDRPYRSAWPREKIIRYIRSQAGKHFDPMVVDAFLEMIAELKDRPGGGEPSG